MLLYFKIILICLKQCFLFHQKAKEHKKLSENITEKQVIKGWPRTVTLIICPSKKLPTESFDCLMEQVF